MPFGHDSLTTIAAVTVALLLVLAVIAHRLSQQRPPVPSSVFPEPDQQEIDPMSKPRFKIPEDVRRALDECDHPWTADTNRGGVVKIFVAGHLAGTVNGSRDNNPRATLNVISQIRRLTRTLSDHRP